MSSLKSKDQVSLEKEDWILLSIVSLGSLLSVFIIKANTGMPWSLIKWGFLVSIIFDILFFVRSILYRYQERAKKEKEIQRQKENDEHIKQLIHEVLNERGISYR